MREHGPPSPRDPLLWFELMLGAIKGLQVGDKEPAAAYLRFVAQHRGRDVAEATRERIKAYARDRAFEPKQKDAPPTWRPPPPRTPSPFART